MAKDHAVHSYCSCIESAAIDSDQDSGDQSYEGGTEEQVKVAYRQPTVEILWTNPLRCCPDTCISPGLHVSDLCPVAGHPATCAGQSMWRPRCRRNWVSAFTQHTSVTIIVQDAGASPSAWSLVVDNAISRTRERLDQGLPFKKFPRP